MYSLLWDGLHSLLLVSIPKGVNNSANMEVLLLDKAQLCPVDKYV